MRRTLPLLLVLAGCGGTAGPIAGDTPAQAECRAEARQAPSVLEFNRRVVIGNVTSEENMRQARQEAEGRAFVDCLRRRGLTRGGGVEALRRPGL